MSMKKEDSEDRLHACPSCGSQAVRRSLRHGFVENVLYRILAIRPYRCMACDLRFTDRGVGHGRKVSTRD
jgi:DNA-directed RNA polymerase subunit RPC12/RpoP